MSTASDRLMTQINARRERERASDREIARLSGVTVEELNEDTIQPDPRPEDEQDHEQED